ncbi:MAG: hypothetical protein RLY14_3106 [Planctomycetota bacterium]|jgi:hypothetical protein
MTEFQWNAMTSSVIGEMHRRRNMPNQDAISFRKLPGEFAAVVLAVSDGHGSDKCPRSETGSRLAVEAASKVFADFWESIQAKLASATPEERRHLLSNIERNIRKNLIKLIVTNWVSLIEEHTENNPFTRDYDRQEKLLAYGATLTIAFVCDFFFTCLRLGDCEILIVDQAMMVHRMDTANPNQVGEDTDSLCMPDADQKFSVLFSGDTSDAMSKPKLFLVCSDGYEKAFQNRAGFEKSAIDFATLLATAEGRVTIENSMEQWLNESSTYSGDDVSLGLLFEYKKDDDRVSHKSDTSTLEFPSAELTQKSSDS